MFQETNLNTTDPQPDCFINEDLSSDSHNSYNKLLGNIINNTNIFKISNTMKTKEDNSLNPHSSISNLTLNIQQQSSINASQIETPIRKPKRKYRKTKNPSETKVHQCPHEGCGRIYTKGSHLKTHFRTHTGFKFE